MTRTHEEFLYEIDAILARYIAGGYESEGGAQCPGSRETLDGKLVCPCNPELEATHGRDDETHS